MSLGAPLFLLALPLAGLPVLFHLLMRRKKQGLEFSTFLFFTRADPRLHARHRIRERLMLALRVLFIALVILALSRPRVSAPVTAQARLALAIILDNSASMDAGPAGSSKLEQAVAGARALLDTLADDSRISLTLLVDDPVIEGLDTTTDRPETIRNLLDDVRPTHAGGRVPDALARAGAALQAAIEQGSPAAALHIFTDLQAGEWSGEQLQLPRLDIPLATVLHRLHGGEEEHRDRDASRRQ